MEHAEKWRPVYGWSRFYEVSDIGRVRSKRTGKIIEQRANVKGYLMVDLVRHVKGIRTKKTRYVHRLVCRAFNGKSPKRNWHVHHRDIDQTNNHKDNLEWKSPEDNLAEQLERQRQEFLDPVPF